MAKDELHHDKDDKREKGHVLSTEEIFKRPFTPDPDALPTKNRLGDLGRVVPQ